MKAILMLDWYLLFNKFMGWFMFTLCCAPIAVMSDDVAHVAFALLVLSPVFQILTLAPASEKQDVFLLLMPVDRTAIVRERYLTVLLPLVPGLAVTVLAGLIQGPEAILSALILLGVETAVPALILPLIFRYDIDISIRLLVGLIYLSITAFLLSDPFGLDTGTLLFWLSIGAPVAGVLLLVLSYPISLKMINERDY